jgi:hypothetical protein
VQKSLKIAIDEQVSYEQFAEEFGTMFLEFQAAIEQDKANHVYAVQQAMHNDIHPDTMIDIGKASKDQWLLDNDTRETATALDVPTANISTTENPT